MERNLSVSMRPNRFSEVVGQENIKKQIINQFSQSVPVFIMLVGNSGVGKTTLARIIALSVQEENGVFGEPSEDTLNNESMFDIMEMNCATVNKIDDIRELSPHFTVYPRFGKYKVFILDEAQQITPAAQNALLKPLEEGSGANLFIIGTTNPEKIIDAIRRRAKIFHVPELEYEAIFQLIEKVAKKIDPVHPKNSEEIKELADAFWKEDIRSAGNVVMGAELFCLGSSVEESVLVQKTGSSLDVEGLVKAVLAGNWTNASKILALAKPVDCDHIRARLAHRLSGILLNTPIGARADKLQSFIHEIVSYNMFEQGLQLRATIASIYKICKSISYKETV